VATEDVLLAVWCGDLRHLRGVAKGLLPPAYQRDT
jgi:hypothetical protein